MRTLTSRVRNAERAVSAAYERQVSDFLDDLATLLPAPDMAELRAAIPLYVDERVPWAVDVERNRPLGEICARHLNTTYEAMLASIRQENEAKTLCEP